MPTFGRDQVLAMAPDAGAAKAGLSQANSRRWTGCGRNERAVWGECQGSGQLPYLTQAALDDGSTKCSCPSRKFPCKHALGLLLLDADGAIPAGIPPGWVTEWLAARTARPARPARSQRSDGPVDPPRAERPAATPETEDDPSAAALRR